VPFLYKQYKSARRIGKPQPLKILEQKIPFFDPSTSNAMRIQRVVLLPDKQQFIKTSCVSPQGYVNSTSKRIKTCGYFFLLHNIPSTFFLCLYQNQNEKKIKKLVYFVALKEKIRYNVTMFVANMLLQFDRVNEQILIFCLRVSC